MSEGQSKGWPGILPKIWVKFVADMAPTSAREQEPGKQPSKESKKIFNIALGT
jgi:hypothetical protein